MTRPPRNIPASMRQRLLDRARIEKADYNLLLVRYAAERLLYRLTRSDCAGRFVLKGAMLFVIWEGAPHRATRDIDLLGFGDPSPEGLAKIFRDICAVQAPEDGMAFDPDSVRTERITALQAYGGVRVSMAANLAGARIPVQVDIGFGDVVTPAPEHADFPTILPIPAARLRIYPRETVVSEKLEAIARLQPKREARRAATASRS